MKDGKAATPMLEQYFRLKSEQPDALLFFRLGDFYELFDQDAEIAAPLLDLQLTSRDGRVAMCGVPHHAVNQYARRLLGEGLTVAIAEQMEDPQQAKGLVDRQIVRVLTPGTVIPEGDEASPRLGVLYRHRQGWVVVVAELSTGTCHVAEGTQSQEDRRQLQQLWSIWCPDEYLSNGDYAWHGGGVRVDGDPYFRRTDPLQLERLVTEKLGISSFRRWGLDGRTAVHEALFALWRYLETLQRRAPVHLTDIQVHPLGDEMTLSERSLRQLDITSGDYSLWHRLNLTVTAMGARRLADWLEHPLRRVDAIEARRKAVGHWISHPMERAALRDALKQVGDLSRRVARVSMGIGRPRDVAGILAALRALPDIWPLAHHDAVWPMENSHALDRLAQLARELDVLADPVPARWDDTPLVRPGVDSSVDSSRRLLEDQRAALLELEEAERERSQIKSLRVGYHRTFGYYLEVARSQAKDVPSDWHRRQTTAHTERFLSEPLRELERAIRGAEDVVRIQERNWAARLQALVNEAAAILSPVASWLSELDVLATLSEAAVKFRYHPAEVRAAGAVSVQGMRHPVLEGVLGDYVTSDVDLPDVHQALIITGPNMGGKSTFMRALAQNVILAQIGGWVAAEEFEAPVFDAVLTRIGADDDLVRGQSTFMVEMEEVSAILHQASPASLVLLDELGRGTSTYDGLAIAEAVIERLAMPEGPLTLFATHYHELTALAEHNPHVRNLTVEVLEGPKGPIFTHRVIPGQASRSYGIEVARLAGLPGAVVRRAEHHLNEWESQAREGGAASSAEQVTFYAPDPLAGPLLESLRSMNPDDLSPREAWMWIADWHRRVRGGDA